MAPSWHEQLVQVLDKSLRYPDYYTKPFHAYNDGNLCWEAAFQVSISFKAYPEGIHGGGMLKAVCQGFSLKESGDWD